MSKLFDFQCVLVNFVSSLAEAQVRGLHVIVDFCVNTLVTELVHVVRIRNLDDFVSPFRDLNVDLHRGRQLIKQRVFSNVLLLLKVILIGIVQVLFVATVSKRFVGQTLVAKLMLQIVLLFVKFNLVLPETMTIALVTIEIDSVHSSAVIFRVEGVICVEFDVPCARFPRCSFRWSGLARRFVGCSRRWVCGARFTRWVQLAFFKVFMDRVLLAKVSGTLVCKAVLSGSSLMRQMGIAMHGAPLACTSTTAASGGRHWVLKHDAILVHGQILRTVLIVEILFIQLALFIERSQGCVLCAARSRRTRPLIGLQFFWHDFLNVVVVDWVMLLLSVVGGKVRLMSKHRLDHSLFKVVRLLLPRVRHLSVERLSID